MITMAGSVLYALALLGLATACTSAPVASADDILPIEQVTFQLYTTGNSASGVRIITGDTSTLEGFDPNLPTKILVHGWMDELGSGIIQKLKNEFLKLEPMNVIGVGWPECAHNVLYEEAVECGKQLGEYIGDLLLWLRDTTGLDPANVHGIGHSLGAQAISFVSRSVRISRISALDPAAPLFAHVDTYNRVDAGDADFVDAFHTSVKLVGMKNPIAHVDFYPNGGAEQPGCGGIFGSCAHSAAYEFYAFTIAEENREVYLAHQCDSYDDARNGTCIGEPQVAMGYWIPLETRGIFYANITSVPDVSL